LLVKPRKVVLFKLVITELEATIRICISFCFFGKKLLKWVLLQFSVKRLLWNQFIEFITELTLILNSPRLLFEIILVSSANNMVLANLLMVHERSFMYIRNSNGPKIKLCGTPCFTSSYSDDNLLLILSFITVLWYLLFIDKTSLVYLQYQKYHKIPILLKVYHD
jgi:hypothetical protein